MPLGVREVLLIMRARDEASRTIVGLGSVFGQVGTRAQQLGGRLIGVGSAVSGVGAGMLGVGAAGLAFFNSAAVAAADYRQQAALSLTQVDGFKASVQDLEKLGLDIAKSIPAPLEQLQPALYDIFSSMNVNLEQARTLLTGFAKEAVAGQVDVQTAGRSTIAIMNAFKIPVEDANKVLDFQFQLVRKGVGTYAEFASTMGRAIPSTVRAGQTVETLGGMLAFLTRNGLSAANASSSAARALDALSNSKVTDRLTAMGISTKDAAGNFLPMVDVVGQLSTKLSGMPKPEQVAILQELFKGAGGTIQARRFFDLAINNFGQLKGLVDDMSSENTKGALKAAYDIMFKQPQSQAQLFTNRLNALKIEIGQQLLPIKMKLVEIGMKVLKMFEGLSDGTKQVIVWIGVAAAIFMVVAGVILFVGGAILIVVGLFSMMSATVLIVIGVIIYVIAVLALVATAIINNWGGIRDFFVSLWDDIVVAFNEARAQIEKRWNDLVAAAIRLWGRIRHAVEDALDSIQNTFQHIWAGIENWWNGFGPQFLQSLADTWHQLEDAFNSVWPSIQEAVSHAMNFIMGIIQVVLAVITWLWDTWGQNILNHLANVWNLIVGIVQAGIQFVQSIIEIVTGIINGDWTTVWNGIKDFFGALWNAILTIVTFALATLVNWFEALPGKLIAAIWWLAGALWDIFWGAVTAAFNAAVAAGAALLNWFADLPGKIVGAVGDLWNTLVHAGERLIGGLLHGIKQAFQDVKDFVGGIADSIASLKGPPVYDAKVLTNNGKLIMQGLGEGLATGWIGIQKQLQGYNPSIAASIGMSGSAGGGSAPGVGAGGDIHVNVQSNADPYQIGRELAWVLATNPYATSPRAA